jgi:hypothetical protein
VPTMEGTGARKVGKRETDALASRAHPYLPVAGPSAENRSGRHRDGATVCPGELEKLLENTTTELCQHPTGGAQASRSCGGRCVVEAPLRVSRRRFNPSPRELESPTRRCDWPPVRSCLLRSDIRGTGVLVPPRGASSRSASDFGAAAAFAFNTFDAEPIAELPTSGSPESSEDTGHRHVRLARVRNVAPFASQRQVDEEAMQIPPAFALARDEVAGLRRQWCATLRRSRHTVG